MSYIECNRHYYLFVRGNFQIMRGHDPGSGKALSILDMAIDKDGRCSHIDFSENLLVSVIDL